MFYTKKKYKNLRGYCKRIFSWATQKTMEMIFFTTDDDVHTLTASTVAHSNNVSLQTKVNKFTVTNMSNVQ